MADQCAGDSSLQRLVEALWAREDAASASAPNPPEPPAHGGDESQNAAIGPYELRELIGAGGMGAVYRAWDRDLNRDVALKFPANRLLNDETARKRFLAEARAAAALEHPNVCTIYQVGEHQGNPYIAMAFLRGRTLASRIHDLDGPMPLAEAIETAHQIALGLAAAHAKGIVHRDVKPANVMLLERPGARDVAQLLDFGIARLAGDTSLTQEAGARLGTAAYMSPEQTRGDEVDHRTDIWSLGAVLYEMVAGVQPFAGVDPLDRVQATQGRKPRRLRSYRPETPPSLQRVMDKALAPSPGDRYQQITEMVADLDRVLSDLREESPERRPQELRWLGLALATAATVALGFWVLVRSAGEPPEPLTARPLTSDTGYEWGPALSPDGDTVAYSAATEEDLSDADLFLLRLEGGAPLRLAPTAQAEFSPAWSPDGSEIAFLRSKPDGRQQYDIRIVSSFGGVDRFLASVRPPPSHQMRLSPPHLDWSSDGARIVAVDQRRPDRGRHPDARPRRGPGPVPSPYIISSIDVRTGQKRELTDPPRGIVGDLYPRISPDGARIAFTRLRTHSIGTVMVADLGDDGLLASEPRPIGTGRRPYTTTAAWTPDGRHLLFASGSSGNANLWAASGPGDLSPRLLLALAPRMTMLSVRDSLGPKGWRLVYVEEREDQSLFRVPLERREGWPVATPNAEPELLFGSSYDDAQPALAPDDRRLAFVSSRTGSQQIWLGDLDTGELIQATNLPDIGIRDPMWSPDGGKLVFAVEESGTSNIYLLPVDSLRPRPVVVGDSLDRSPFWTRDGAAIGFLSDREGPGSVWVCDLDGSNLRAASAEDLRGALPAASQRPRPSPAGGPPRLGGFPVITFVPRVDGAFTRAFDRVVRFYHFERDSSRPVYTVGRRSGPRFAVSSDSRWLYFSEPTSPRTDLMLVENLEDKL